MKRLSVIAILYICLLPMAMLAETVTDTLPEGEVRRLVYTTKVLADKWCVSWLGNDDMVYRLKVEKPPAAEIDDVHGAGYRLTLEDSVGTIISKGVLSKTDRHPVAIRLMEGRSGLVSFSTTGGKKFFEDVEAEGPKAGSVIVLTTDPKGKITYHSINADVMPRPEIYEDFGPVTDSAGYAGKWRYLDEVTPRTGAVVAGGRYVLDLFPIPDSGGGYVAVISGGVTMEKNRWADGSIKAIFKPTDFAGHYDVEWIGADGRQVPDSVSATFQGDNLLTIEFPILESTLRFSRSL